MPKDNRVESNAAPELDMPEENISSGEALLASKGAHEPNEALSESAGAPSETALDSKKAPEDFFVAEEYGDSFAALMESMAQGRDLKMKRKALEEYVKTLDTLKAAYNDRLNIAANYDAVVSEQQKIVAESSACVDECKRKSEEIQSKIAEKDDEIARLKVSQGEAMKPLQDALNRHEAIVSDTKTELKQAKAQRDSLDMFENPQEDGEAQQDMHSSIVAEIETKLDNQIAAVKADQKAIATQEKSDKAALKQVADAIKALNYEKEKIAKEASGFQKKVDDANNRIAFCQHVKDNPEETESMKLRIAENEKTAAEMSAQIEQLASVHEVSKAASSKARTVVIVAAIAVVIFIALFIYLANR